MFRSGCENGNNNAYCQDNEVTWIDWEKITEEGRAFVEFTRKLIAIRKAYPILNRARFLVGQNTEEFGVKDVAWLTPAGTEMTQERMTRMRNASACCSTGARRAEAVRGGSLRWRCVV